MGRTTRVVLKDLTSNSRGHSSLEESVNKYFYPLDSSQTNHLLIRKLSLESEMSKLEGEIRKLRMAIQEAKI